MSARDQPRAPRDVLADLVLALVEEHGGRGFPGHGHRHGHWDDGGARCEPCAIWKEALQAIRPGRGKR